MAENEAESNGTGALIVHGAQNAGDSQLRIHALLDLLTVSSSAESPSRA